MVDALPVGTIERLASLPAEAVAIVRAYQQASKADSTVRAYRSDVQVFQAWRDRFRFRSLQASPEAVAGFLMYEAEAGRSASTIDRRLAAIRSGHELAKAADPTDDEDVRATMNGIQRRGEVAPTHKTAATVDVLQMLHARTPDTLTGKRGLAMLALGFAGVFGRSELVALDVRTCARIPRACASRSGARRSTKRAGALRRRSRTAGSYGRWRLCGTA